VGSGGSRNAPIAKSSGAAPWVVAWAWVLCTYLLSSNLLVYVGFVVADRALYLPSFGFCVLLAQAITATANAAVKAWPQWAWAAATPAATKHTGPSSQAAALTLAAVVVAAYVAKQQAQTDR
jgi:hypothetical protein